MSHTDWKSFIPFMTDIDGDIDNLSFVLGFELGCLYRDMTYTPAGKELKVTLHRQNDERYNLFANRLGWKLIERENICENWMLCTFERRL